MCYFILLIAESEADIRTMRELAAPYGLQLPTLTNASLERQASGGHVLMANRGGCDCRTSLGDAWRLAGEPTDAQKQRHEIQKLKRKGWNDARIERWIRNRQVVAKRENRLQHDKEQAQSSTLTLDEWKSLLSNLTDAVGRTSLLLHMFSGDPQEDEIAIQARQMICGREGITDDLLLNVAEDVLYHFSAN